jgi:hypothetical protein
VAGKARLFDGFAAYAEASASADFSLPRLTLRTWIRMESWPRVLGVIVSALDSQSRQGWFLGVLPSGRVVVMDVPTLGNSLWLESSRPIELGRWQCVTVTFDRPVTFEGSALDGPAGKAVIYLDGEREAEGNLGLSDAAPKPWVLAKASWWDGYHAHAAIDEMRMDRGVWNAARVQSDYIGIAPPPPDPAPEPIAYWRLDELGTDATASLMDDSGRGHVAVVAGAGSRAISGVAAGARSFPSGAYARVEPHPDFSSPSFSFAAWVRVESYPSNWGVVFTNFDGRRGWFLGMDTEGRLVLSLWAEPSVTAWVRSEGRLATGRWQHIAATFDERTRRAAIYVDGQADRSFGAAFTPSEGVAPTLARASWFDGYYLACDLDEAKVFQEALTAEEIRQEFERFRSNSR